MPSLNLRPAALAAALLVAPGPLAAGEIVLSAGADSLRGSDREAAAAVELRSDALWSRGRFGLMAGAALQVDKDVWAGAGPVLTADLSGPWRLEASVMLGGYGQGEGGQDLGTDFPMFRSQIGASYAIAEGWRLGLALDHKSNARTAERNPGVETLMVTLAHSF